MTTPERDFAHLDTEPERFRYGTAVADVRPAAGVAGDLCHGADGRYFFHVHGNHGSFKDYDLRHDDLRVIISVDALASFYSNGEDCILEHSPVVLGLKPD